MNDHQKSFLNLISRDIPDKIANYTQDNFIIGGQPHKRIIDIVFPYPHYKYNNRHFEPQSSPSSSIMPQFYFSLKNKVRIKAGDYGYELKEKDCCVIPRMLEEYESFVMEDQTYEIILISFVMATRLWIAHIKYNGSNKASMINLPHFNVSAKSFELFCTLDQVAWPEHKNILLEFFKHIQTAIKKENYFFPVIDPKEKTWKQRSIAKISSYIEQNLTSKLTLEEIAKEAGVSTRHLVSLFKKEFGDSVF